MKLLNKLKNKGVKVNEVPNGGACLKKRWEDNFANHLSDEEKKAIYLHDCDGMCGYLWHIFSYKKKQCLIGEEAEGAFENEEKKFCYIFYQNSEEALALEDATAFDINDLLGEADVYVVDREFKWTFIQTHEKGWIGPFFCRKG